MTSTAFEVSKKVAEDYQHLNSETSTQSSLALRGTFHLVSLLSLCYNLDHGILPAALPQIHERFGADPLREALLQSVAVAGILLGIIFSLIYRLSINKGTTFCSMFLTGLCLVATALTTSLKTALPSSIYIWRFLTGLFGSYTMIVLPQWIEYTFPPEEHTGLNSELMIAGMSGTVIGYVLTYITSPSAGWIPSILGALDQSLKSHLPRVLFPHFSSLRIQFLDHFDHSLDFRMAFFIAGLITVTLTIIGCLIVPSHHMFVPDHSDENAVRQDHRRFGLFFLRWTANENSEKIWKELKELVSYRCFNLLLLGIGTTMTVANGMNFWLYSFYRTKYKLPEREALVCVASVFLLGPLIGLRMSSKIHIFTSLTTRLKHPDGTVFSSRGFLALAILGALSTVSGLYILSRTDNGYIVTMGFTIALMFGSAVVPIAQASFAKVVPPSLGRSAAIFYQFVFQSSWLTGPLAPIFLSVFSSIDPEIDGVVCLAAYNGLTVVFFLVAYYIRRREEDFVQDIDMNRLRRALGQPERQPDDCCEWLSIYCPLIDKQENRATTNTEGTEITSALRRMGMPKVAVALLFALYLGVVCLCGVLIAIYLITDEWGVFNCVSAILVFFVLRIYLINVKISTSGILLISAILIPTEICIYRQYEHAATELTSRPLPIQSTLQLWTTFVREYNELFSQEHASYAASHRHRPRIQSGPQSTEAQFIETQSTGITHANQATTKPKSPTSSVTETPTTSATEAPRTKIQQDAKDLNILLSLDIDFSAVNRQFKMIIDGSPDARHVFEAADEDAEQVLLNLVESLPLQEKRKRLSNFSSLVINEIRFWDAPTKNRFVIDSYRDTETKAKVWNKRELCGIVAINLAASPSEYSTLSRLETAAHIFSRITREERDALLAILTRLMEEIEQEHSEHEMTDVSSRRGLQPFGFNEDVVAIDYPDRDTDEIIDGAMRIAHKWRLRELLAAATLVTTATLLVALIVTCIVDYSGWELQENPNDDRREEEERQAEFMRAYNEARAVGSVREVELPQRREFLQMVRRLPVEGHHLPPTERPPFLTRERLSPVEETPARFGMPTIPQEITETLGRRETEPEQKETETSGQTEQCGAHSRPAVIPLRRSCRMNTADLEKTVKDIEIEEQRNHPRETCDQVPSPSPSPLLESQASSPSPELRTVPPPEAVPPPVRRPMQQVRTHPLYGTVEEETETGQRRRQPSRERRHTETEQDRFVGVKYQKNGDAGGERKKRRHRFSLFSTPDLRLSDTTTRRHSHEIIHGTSHELEDIETQFANIETSSLEGSLI